MERLIDIAELRSIQMDILMHIDTFCKQNGIMYYLCGGSMLGAVRHHGYIPWDDDIDIMMFREDYERFLALYRQKENGEYCLHHYSIDDKFPYTFAKIDNNRTVLVEDIIGQSINIGVNIDIFPIDVIPENKNAQKRMYRIFELYQSLMELKQIPPEAGRVWYKNIVLRLSNFFLHVIPVRFIIKRIENNAMRYHKTQSDYCGIAIWGYGIREINLRSNWKETLYVPFEGYLMPIPSGYDNYLTCVYGDYMQLPPENKRTTHHHFKAWWK